jgi:heme-degrading monooxygenase HmoA
MYVVIFRASMRKALSEESMNEYTAVATQMRALAMQKYACLDFVSMTENDQELAVSYWLDEASILAWRKDPQHQQAQAQGKLEWYDDYRVEVLSLERRYDSNKASSAHLGGSE